MVDEPSQEGKNPSRSRMAGAGKSEEALESSGLRGRDQGAHRCERGSGTEGG